MFSERPYSTEAARFHMLVQVSQSAQLRVLSSKSPGFYSSGSEKWKFLEFRTHT